jgi:hypothetical protein
MSPMVLAAPAAAASATVSITPGYVIRPTVPRLENPATSAFTAQSEMTADRRLRT